MGAYRRFYEQEKRSKSVCPCNEEGGEPLEIITTLSKSIKLEALDKALVAVLRKRDKRARKERDDYVNRLIGYSVCYGCNSNYLGDYYWEKILWDEYWEAERIAAKCHDAYRRVKNFFRALRVELKRIWLQRIRYASRAIGNERDYSLLMVATPPTMVSVDEYFDAYVLNIHQRGGAMVGSLA